MLGQGGGAGSVDAGVSGGEQVASRLDADELGGLAEGVEEGGDLRAAARAGAVVVLASDDDATQGALDAVGVERDSGIVEEAGQPLPQPEHVLDGAAEAAARQDAL